MTHSTCPRCGIRIGSRHREGPTHCPRCLARNGASIELVRTMFREKLTDRVPRMREV
jgi:hypothetical protein